MTQTPLWLKKVQALEHHHGDVFRDFVRMAACVCSCGEREDEYRRTVQRYPRAELETLCEAFGDVLGHKLRNPFDDIFGETYMARVSPTTRQRLGEVYTPSAVAMLMARMSVHPPEPGRTLTVAEPACGSGILVLGFAEALEGLGVSRLHLQVQATDLNPLAADMALINLGLAGIPAIVRHGNTLTNEVFHAHQTPAWRFARPYSGEPQLEQLSGGDLLTMLRVTVPPPTRLAS
ncbi:SAM-dependent methyltransferase [Deinococcus sp. HMF7604]|nr:MULTISPECIES: N-6 DNA methylase [Deinococcus]MBZ9752139.1 SAM-dependent methyltransferase [Deinococcus betulae]